MKRIAVKRDANEWRSGVMDATGNPVESDGGNDAERVSPLSVAVSYLLHVSMLCVLFCIRIDVDTVMDFLDGGNWQKCVPPVMLCYLTGIVLLFARDCERRRRKGYWEQSFFLTPRCWLVSMTVWGAVLVSCCHGLKTHKETVDGVTWRYMVCNGNAVITRGRNSCPGCAAISVTTAGNLTVPSSLGGHPVTGIGDFAFCKCRRLTSVTIPDGVEWIGIEAFNRCDGLTSMALPDSVTHIMYEAFRGCSNLVSVTIPANIEHIDESAFAETPFFDNAPDGLVSFDGMAYKWKGPCPAEVTIPDGVTRVYDRAFERCSGLIHVMIGNSVTNVGKSVFRGCARLTSATIGNHVEGIGDRAFYACLNLKAVSIPESLTSVGNEAFYGCPIKRFYVGKGDGARVRKMLRGKGVDVNHAEFVESEEAFPAQPSKGGLSK